MLFSTHCQRLRGNELDKYLQGWWGRVETGGQIWLVNCRVDEDIEYRCDSQVIVWEGKVWGPLVDKRRMVINVFETKRQTDRIILNASGVIILSYIHTYILTYILHNETLKTKQLSFYILSCKMIMITVNTVFRYHCFWPVHPTGDVL